MPATPKATKAQIEAVLWQWAGDISQAAAQLGMTRRALYYRIEALGIDTERVRRDSQASHFGVKLENVAAILHTTNTVNAVKGNMGNVDAESRPKVDGEKYPRQTERHIVRGEMATASAITPPPPPDEPMQGRLPRNPRVRPDHLRRLQELKWTMSALFKRDLSETDILGMILDETLPAFEARAARGGEANPEKPASKRSRKPRSEGSE